MDIFAILLLVILILFILRNSKTVKEGYTNSVRINMYYINVKTSTVRNQELLAKFKDLNLPFKLQRIEASTPADLKNYSDLDKACPYASNYELACTVSHLRAIFTAYKNDDDYAIIFEDDVVIHRFPNVERLIEIAPSDWDILQLFTLDYRIYEKEQLWVPHHNDNYTAAAYIINRKGMVRILKTYLSDFNGIDFGDFNMRSFKKMSKFNCAADYVVYNAANTYVCTDLFFTVETKDSTIHTIHLLFQYYKIQKILSMFAKTGYKTPDLGINVETQNEK